MSVLAVQSDDPTAIQRRAADPVATVWVNASAGTGKTKVLIDRLLTLLLADTSPERILCLTYTKAAAAEMNARITRSLAAWAIAGESDLDSRLADLLGRPPTGRERHLARRLFFKVLDVPGGMKIQTIHGFCQSLLGRFPLEAGIPPHFDVLDERDGAELMRQSVREVVRQAEMTGGPLAAALDAIAWRLPESELLTVIGELSRHRRKLDDSLSGHGSIDGIDAAIRSLLGLEGDEDAERVTADACALAVGEEAALRRASAALLNGSTTDQRRGEDIIAWLTADPSARGAGFGDYAGCFLTEPNDEPLPAIRKRLITKSAAAAAPEAEGILSAEAERVRAVVLRQRAARLAEASVSLLRIGRAVLDAYRQLKERRAILDYDDLILKTRDLLLTGADTSWVHYKLDGGIDHLLIDEAQDTSPEQWDIVRALTAEFFAGKGAHEAPRTVFAVGDVKQSIFSFQNAEPAEFLRNSEYFAACATNAQRLWRAADLTVSFRSTEVVLDAVDAVFAEPAARAGVALDDKPIRHQVSEGRRGAGGLVEVWPPLVVASIEDPEEWTPPINPESDEPPQLRMARIVAERIRAMVQDGETLPSRGRPIRPGDIMVLVRRRTAFVEALVRELKTRKVPVAGVDRMILTEQLAVMDLLALGRFVLLPEDDLNLAVLLKGPLIGLSEEALFRLAHGREGSLWEALKRQAGGDDEFAAAHARLAEWLGRADQTPPFAFFSDVLGAGGGRRRLLERLGPEAEEPIAEFLQLALTLERSHPPSLQGFIAWIERSEAEIKRDLEQAPDAVRVITVHGAKGLQAPIVFLPDTLQVPRKTPRLLWHAVGDRPPLLLWAPRDEEVEERFVAARQVEADRQAEEYRRLMYVAMTRAEDRLIVCGWQDRGKTKIHDGCWYRLIRDGLEHAGDRAGLEKADDGGLRLSCPQRRAVTPDSAPVPMRPADLPAWAHRPAPVEALPPKPLTPSRGDDDPPVRSPLAPRGGNPYRRGRLIHLLLQNLPELPAASWPDVLSGWLARPAYGLGVAEQAEIAAEVMRVLTDPETASLFGPDSLAEVPISGEINGRLIVGQIDRLLVTETAVTIIDYKTDRPPPRTAAEVPIIYLRQMAAYRAAVRQIYPGLPVICQLLWTDGPRRMALCDANLDPHEIA